MREASLRPAAGQPRAQGGLPHPTRRHERFVENRKRPALHTEPTRRAPRRQPGGGRPQRSVGLVQDGAFWGPPEPAALCACE